MNLYLTIALLVTLFVATDGGVVDRTPANELGFQQPIVIAYYKQNSELTAKSTTYWRNRMIAVSEEHPDLTFAISDPEGFDQRLIDYGFEFDWKRKLETEPIVIAEDKDLKRFLLDDKLTTESLETFVRGFKSKQLKPHIKSEAIPDNTGKGVKEVVGKTFYEMAIDNPKDVFIMMYAYWCGHCKDALPIWKEFGERMADEPDVDILQMELTRNEVHKPWRTMNYPTIYWLAAGHKYVTEKYMGKRSVQRFIEYVAQRSTQPLLKFDRKGKARKEKAPKEEVAKEKVAEEKVTKEQIAKEIPQKTEL